MSRDRITAAVCVTLLTVALALAVSAAVAADAEGKVQSVDTYARTVTLDNGTTLWAGDGVSLDSVKEGDLVKVSFEERDGKNVATSIEVK